MEVNNLEQNDYDHWGRLKHINANGERDATYSSWYVQSFFTKPVVVNQKKLEDENFEYYNPEKIYFKLKFNFNNRISYNNNEAEYVKTLTSLLLIVV